jgi:tetratricopeptide (TPR) repeat protein
LRLAEAQARWWTGHPAASEVAASEAVTLLRGAARLHAASELIAAKGQLARYAEIEAVVAQARRWPEAGAHRAAWQQVLLRAASYLPSGGRLELTEALLREVESASPQLEPTLDAIRHRARGLMVMGTQAWLAVHHFQKSAAAFEAASDLRGSIDGRCNLAAALGTLGRLEETERQLRQLLPDIERMNLMQLEPAVRLNLGIVRGDLGDLVEGAAIVEAALASARRHDDQRIEAYCHYALAVIDVRAGRFSAAEEHGRAAVAVAVAAFRPLALASLAGALRGQGRLEEALAQAREANRLLDEQGYVEDNEALVRLSLVECLLAAGDPLGAREAGLRAYRRLIERATAITEPAWRACFLEALPDHRRTLEVARQLGLPPAAA